MLLFFFSSFQGTENEPKTFAFPNVLYDVSADKDMQSSDS